MGTVIAGEVVSHDFPLTNDSPDTIRILQKSDVQINCGCAGLVPARRVVGPGEKTMVKATVRTYGKHGAFANGGQIEWTADSGRKKTSVFRITGNAVEALEASPGLLVFDEHALESGEALEVIFRAAIPVDWRTFQADITSDSFRLIRMERGPNEAHCFIKCMPPKECLDEYLSAVAIGRVSPRPSSDKSPPAQISASMGLHADRVLPLNVIPRVLQVTFPDRRSRGTAKVLLLGKLVAQSQTVLRSVTCDGKRLTFALHHIPHDAKAVVTLSAPLWAATVVEAKRFLILTFSNGEIVRVPYVPINAAETPPTRAASQAPEKSTNSHE